MDKKNRKTEYNEDPYNLHDERFTPCPFCGAIHIHHESSHGARWARCQECSSTGGYIFNFEEHPEGNELFNRETVVERWNKRAYEIKTAELWLGPFE